MFLCQYSHARKGIRCYDDAVPGDSYCAKHKGGSHPRIPKIRAKAARRYVGGAERILDEFGVPEDVKNDILASPRDVDAGVLLVEEISRTAGIIDWLINEISKLDVDTEFVYEVVTRTEEHGTNAQGAIDSVTTEAHKELHHYWRMLDKERAHLVSTTTAALRAGIEERRVRMAERSLNSLEAALAMILMDFGLDPHSERVRTIVGSRLREALEANLEPTSSFLRPDDTREAVVVVNEDGSLVKPVQF